MKYIFGVNVSGNYNPIYDFPFIFEFNSIREWVENTRSDDTIYSLLDCSLKNNTPISCMKLHVTIINNDDEWLFTINLNNVREYKKLMNKNRGELERLISEWERDLKINKILED